MKILIISATELELNGLKKHLSESVIAQCDFYVCGVGMVHTCFELTRILLNNTYDLAIQIGIAGAFDRTLKLAEVVWVTKDTFSEMGAQDHDEFLSLIQLGLQSHDEFPYNWSDLVPKPIKDAHALQKFKQVKGITVNTVHGNAQSILNTQMRISPQVESMEGASFFYVCMKLNVPCVQLRAISNYVEPRNKENWEIRLALDNLFTSVAESLNNITK